MAMHLLLIGLLGAFSGFLAIVASQRIEPFYSILIKSIPSVDIQYTPRIKTLYSARQAMEELREMRIRDGYRRELQAIHQILIDEYDFYEQYYPISLRFMNNSFEMKYADGRKQAQRKTSRDDLLSHVDSEISKSIGQVAAYAGFLSIISFAALILLSVI